MNKKFVESLQSTVLTKNEIFTLISIAEKYKTHKDDVENSVENVVSKLDYTGADAKYFINTINKILDILNKQDYALDIAVLLGSLMNITFNYKIKNIIDRDANGMFGNNSPRARGIAFIYNIIYECDEFKTALDTNSDDDFIDSVLNYIEQNKNKLTNYSYDDIEQLIINSKFVKQFDNEITVIDSIYNLINSNNTDDKDYALHKLGKNFYYVDDICDTLKQHGLSCRYLVIGALGFIYLIKDLTDVA